MTHILQQLFIFIFHDKHILFDSHFKEIYYPNDYTLTMVHIRVWNRTYKTLLYPNQWCHGPYIDAHYVSSRLNELRVKFGDIFSTKCSAVWSLLSWLWKIWVQSLGPHTQMKTSFWWGCHHCLQSENSSIEITFQFQCMSSWERPPRMWTPNKIRVIHSLDIEISLRL